ncbi:MAG: hypothetical protein HOC23_15415 [Halieaceae bacterium]|nr:hypothetical protein [Halieaceae bacterium]
MSKYSITQPTGIGERIIDHMEDALEEHEMLMLPLQSPLPPLNSRQPRLSSRQSNE